MSDIATKVREYIVSAMPRYGGIKVQDKTTQVDKLMEREEVWECANITVTLKTVPGYDTCEHVTIEAGDKVVYSQPLWRHKKRGFSGYIAIKPGGFRKILLSTLAARDGLSADAVQNITELLVPVGFVPEVTEQLQTTSYSLQLGENYKAVLTASFGQRGGELSMCLLRKTRGKWDRKLRIYEGTVSRSMNAKAVVDYICRQLRIITQMARMEEEVMRYTGKPADELLGMNSLGCDRLWSNIFVTPRFKIELDNVGPVQMVLTAQAHDDVSVEHAAWKALAPAVTHAQAIIQSAKQEAVSHAEKLKEELVCLQAKI